jgi:copper chaperone CopZ
MGFNMAREAGASPVAEVEFSVPSMMCDGCAEKIRGALIAIHGVQKVKAKLWRKSVQVRYQPSEVHKEQIKDALGAAGFPVTEA